MPKSRELSPGEPPLARSFPATPQWKHPHRIYSPFKPGLPTSRAQVRGKSAALAQGPCSLGGRVWAGHPLPASGDPARSLFFGCPPASPIACWRLSDLPAECDDRKGAAGSRGPARADPGAGERASVSQALRRGGALAAAARRRQVAHPSAPASPLTLPSLVLLRPARQRRQTGRRSQQPHLTGAPPAQDAVDAIGGEQSWRFTFAVGPLRAALLLVLVAHGFGWPARATGSGFDRTGTPLPPPGSGYNSPLFLPRTPGTRVVTEPQ